MVHTASVFEPTKSGNPAELSFETRGCAFCNIVVVLGMTLDQGLAATLKPVGGDAPRNAGPGRGRVF